MEHLKESIRNGVKTVQQLAESGDYQAATQAEYELLIWVIEKLNAGRFNGRDISYEQHKEILSIISTVLDVDFPRSFE
jgi:hypothetical protein